MKEANGARAVYDHVEVSDLCGELRDMAEKIGIEAMRKFLVDFAGAELYVPVKPPRMAVVRFAGRLSREGYTVSQVARKVGVKARTLRAWMVEEQMMTRKGRGGN